MSQRAAAVRRAAAPLPPLLPLTHPLCQDRLTPWTMVSIKLPHPLPCLPHLQGHPHLPRPWRQHPPATTWGKSAACAASSGSPSQRRRCVGNQTSGRWRCGSSSTRSTFGPWRSSLGSRKMRWWVYEVRRQQPEPQLIYRDPAPLKTAVRMRWVLVKTISPKETYSRKLMQTRLEKDPSFFLLPSILSIMIRGTMIFKACCYRTVAGVGFLFMRPADRSHTEPGSAGVLSV